MLSDLSPFYINGRFLTQPQSGVQRFATEITAALIRQHPNRFVILGPRGAQDKRTDVRVIGKRNGQLWEQFELPIHAGDGVLINLGNTGPLRLRAQVVVIHDAAVFANPEAYSWRLRLWYKTAQWHFARAGVRIVTVSAFARNELIRYLGVAADDVAVMSEGTDHMRAITPDYQIISRLPQMPFVLVVGNLAAHKNLQSLSLLAERLKGRGMTLVVTGGIASPGTLRRLNDEALPQPAHYIGRVSDGELKALYETAKCLVFPSLYEGFGLPPMEAMACGCLVAVSRIPALLETCEEAAVFFDPSSPTNVADQVCHLLDNPTLQQQLRAAGVTHAKDYTWGRAANQLASIAQDCLERGTSATRKNIGRFTTHL
jgi:glycosyltransferase involved in cell wall biosynthesis